MIVHKPANKEHEINVGRPDVFNEEDRRYWLAFHNLVETCPQPIVVNAVYYDILDIITNHTGYGGGGFAYMFWFDSEEDKSEFVAAMKDL